MIDRIRYEIGDAGQTDPLTGELVGTLTAREAMECGRATVGPHTYGDFKIRSGRGDTARLTIGDYCSIAVGVEFALGGNHRADWVSTYPFRVLWGLPGAWTDGHPRPERDTVVGNDVWIGTGVLVLPGVSIGDGAVVGARAIVARDVAPYAIVVGNPAREVRRRFSSEQIEALLALRWWDWPEEKVRAHIDLLSAVDVDALLAAAGDG